ncbi:amidohydrolase family protein [Thiomicrorhabdus sp. 6S3-12]|uniref:amidohydrolase family protein n=1 Tax=Thiomicrorhabdus sp. 6S3-12 TaxID=2819681 RepID=UPI001AADDF03|nr:amidohydrolase family protein [Thiomicrorhabdus sp. 6S3-12]MBO1922977.1 amidohydrolase [Thiomicrorhabdus sp. 6S3-12]
MVNQAFSISFFKRIVKGLHCGLFISIAGSLSISSVQAHEPEVLLASESSAATNHSNMQSDSSVYQGKLFDAHLHYAAEDVQNFSPQQIEAIFDRNQVAFAQVSSAPTDGTEILYRAMPQRIIPFYSFYHGFHDKAKWMDDPAVVPATEKALKSGFYRGVGELHLFKDKVNSPVFQQVVLLAKQHRLPLQVHGDAEVVDKVFELYPQATVLWAHLGTRPEVDFLNAMLQKYPQGLYIDTSVRDGMLLSNGKLNKEWRDLFITHQDRFMAAVDTYSVQRWENFDKVVSNIRDWLGDLPPEVAHKIAYQNAAELFNIESVD